MTQETFVEETEGREYCTHEIRDQTFSAMLESVHQEL